MKRHLRQGLILGSAILGIVWLTSCSGSDSKVAAPGPAKPIDAARFYTGRWYEIARTPMKLTDGCVAGTTDYIHRSDGQLIDRDACRMNTPDGQEKVYQGPVTILNPGMNTKITVHYIVWGFIPVGRTYWMLDHDDDYTWFVVANPAFDTISLFTRNPRPSGSEVAALTNHARDLGYDTKKLEFPTPFPPGER